MKQLLIYSIFIVVFLVSCDAHNKSIDRENIILQKKVDSLTNELNKCDMMLESYEGLPLSI